MSQQPQDELVWQAALQYLEYGWSIYPLSRFNNRLTGEHRTLSGKLPASFRYCLQPISTADQLSPELFRGCGVGIVTGKHSGIVVVDVDGKVGLDNAAQLDLPPTRTAKTPNGFHLYYAYPKCMEWLPSSPGSLAEGIDVKGEKGGVVAPPSPHSDGGYYQWIDPDVPIVPLPPDILSQIRSLPHRGLWKRFRNYFFRKYIRHPFNAITGR